MTKKFKYINLGAKVEFSSKPTPKELLSQKAFLMDCLGQGIVKKLRKRVRYIQTDTNLTAVISLDYL